MKKGQSALSFVGYKYTTLPKIKLPLSCNYLEQRQFRFFFLLLEKFSDTQTYFYAISLLLCPAMEMNAVARANTTITVPVVALCSTEVRSMMMLPIYEPNAIHK